MTLITLGSVPTPEVFSIQALCTTIRGKALCLLLEQQLTVHYVNGGRLAVDDFGC